jgi:hypothetical protein
VDISILDITFEAGARKLHLYQFRCFPKNSPFLAFNWIFRDLEYQIYTENYSILIEKEKEKP